LPERYKKSTVETVIEKLKNYGIIDDKMYAESYIKSNSNFSKNKVKQKLMQAGVKSENFDEQICEIDELESSIKHAEKFFKNKEINKQNLEKLIRRLSGMGYGWDTIKSVLNKLKIETEDEV
jgi:regulatory protein